MPDRSPRVATFRGRLRRVEEDGLGAVVFLEDELDAVSNLMDLEREVEVHLPRRAGRLTRRRGVGERAPALHRRQSGVQNAPTFGVQGQRQAVIALGYLRHEASAGDPGPVQP